MKDTRTMKIVRGNKLRKRTRLENDLREINKEIDELDREILEEREK